MIVHVLGVPHTQTNADFLTCAFTQKVWKLCKMMTSRGHTVYHYGAEGSNPECTEHVSVTTRADFERHYPHPGTAFYAHDKPTPERTAYLERWSTRTRQEIAKRMGAPFTEILALSWGGAQCDAVKGIDQFEVESGIGYPYSWAKYRVYESYAWLHMHLGRDNGWGGDAWYWCVIPNAFDLADFEYKEKKSDEFLFIGRLNEDKGVRIAIDVARAVERRITIVGQGDGEYWLKGNDHVRYLPPVGVEVRKRLLSEARAVFVPTRYVEPFGGVNIEAQLSGTPVITTDWGVFPETVIHGLTGWRCRTFEQFVWAARHIAELGQSACREWAARNYSLERVALMYEEFFQQVLNIKTKGFYIQNPGRTNLDWLVRIVPETRDCFALDRPHVPPAEPASAPEPSKEAQWIEAQDWERSWWGLERGIRWDEEEKKQETYARLIGIQLLSTAATSLVDGVSFAILDVGCGPVSMIQRALHTNGSRGVDPLAVSDATRQRYADHGIEFLNIKAEDMPEDRMFDEAWCYNVLQHVEDPDKILGKMVRMAKTVRIFEWIEMGVCPGHMHNLTEQLFQPYFPTGEWNRRIWNVGTLSGDLSKGECNGKYFAMWAEKRVPA
jgi:glycosyltransferase involved in cell wall biosynthesis